VQAISVFTGHDRKTIRKYLAQEPGTRPAYGPRAPRPSKLDKFKPYLEERRQAGVWNAAVLLRELRERRYGGGYTLLTDYLRPQWEGARQTAVRRTWLLALPDRTAAATGPRVVEVWSLVSASGRVLRYCTPAVPLAIHNSSRRVRPETISRPTPAMAQRASHHVRACS